MFKVNDAVIVHGAAHSTRDGTVVAIIERGTFSKKKEVIVAHLSFLTGSTETIYQAFNEDGSSSEEGSRVTISKPVVSVYAAVGHDLKGYVGYNWRPTLERAQSDMKSWDRGATLLSAELVGEETLQNIRVVETK